MTGVLARAARRVLVRWVGRGRVESLIRRTASLAGIDLLRVAYQSIGVLNYETLDATGERFVVDRVLPRVIGSAEPVFLDVGANVGEISLALRRAFPSARIWAFEPNPATFEVLERELRGTGVACERLGLGEGAGAATLHCYAGDPTSGHASLHGEVFRLHRSQGTEGADRLRAVAVALTTLDAFCRERDIRRIDFLKIDVEGHELAVLEGASAMLAAGAIGALQFEFNECNVVARVFLRDFYALLPGYRLYRLHASGLVPLGEYAARNELFQFQNILALRAELAGGVDELTETAHGQR